MQLGLTGSKLAYDAENVPSTVKLVRQGANLEGFFQVPSGVAFEQAKGRFQSCGLFWPWV